jgi:class 3 adenylate cyclase
LAVSEKSDVFVDPAETRRRRRRRWNRIGLPIAGVVVVVGALLGIGYYSFEVNRRDALQLADEVIRSQEQRILREVEAYLAPAPRAVDLLRGVLSDGAFLGSAQGGAEAIGWQILYDNPQLALISYAAPDGSYMAVRREASGSIDTKVIERAGEARRTTWTRRDRAGRTIGVEDDPADTYDPRTRVWYRAAAENPGRVDWSPLYIFFTDRKPGITASEALLAPDGRLAAVFGVDIALDSLSAFLARLRIGRTGRAMIIQNDGTIVAFPDPARTFVARGEQLVPMPLGDIGDPALERAYNLFRVEGHGRRIIEVAGDRYIAAVAPIRAVSSEDWATMIVVPEADFIGFVALHNRSTLVMSGAVALLVALFAALLIRQGLRADRNALLVIAREQAREAQGRAFTELAANAALFDPRERDAIHGLTRVVARVVAARRVAIWRVGADGALLTLEDCRDRENDGHTAGVEFARAQLGGLLPALEAGEEIEARDAARDPRTADFHRLYLGPLGTRALVAVPIRLQGRSVGVVCLEDWRADGALGFARAVASMLSGRFAAALREGAEQSRGAAPAAGASAEAGPRLAASDHDDVPAPAALRGMRRSRLDAALARRVDGAARPGGGADGLRAQVFSHATVATIQFTDAGLLAHAGEEAGDRAVAALVVAHVEEVAVARAIPYVRILGDKVVMASGFVAAQAGRDAVAVAEAAVELRERLAQLFTALGQRLEFRIGIDTGAVVGASLGEDGEAFNLWGDATRVSETMAETGIPGAAVVTEPSYRLLRERFVFRARGSFFLAGAGEMSTYLLASRL